MNMHIISKATLATLVIGLVVSLVSVLGMAAYAYTADQFKSQGKCQNNSEIQSAYGTKAFAHAECKYLYGK
jgi:hypothetical protein